MAVQQVPVQRAAANVAIPVRAGHLLTPAANSVENVEDPASTQSTDRLPAVRVRLTRLFESSRWKHAIGEIVLIVLGVLIALAVNNWNASRQQRRVELTVLAQLRAALVGDLSALRAVDDAVRVREKRIEMLLADLDRGVVTGDSADVRFGAVLRIWELRLNRSLYETLKAKGLDLISNDSLRLRVAALYDNTYVDLDQTQADDRSTVLDLVRPYYLT